MNAIPLTADLCAYAIIAATREYGIDIRLASKGRTFPLSPLAAAAYGLIEGTGAAETRVRRILGVRADTLANLKSVGGAKFWTAAQAAEIVSRERFPSEARKALESPPKPVASPRVRAPHRLAPAPPQDIAARAWRRSDPPPPSVIRSTLPRIAQAVTPRREPTCTSKAEAAPVTVLRDRVIATLRDAPSMATSLAILCDAKELAVCETLKQLEIEGVVEPGPIPEQGRRYRSWSLVQRMAAE